MISIMVAAKFFDDQYFNNAYYAKVGGVPCFEMNALETELLFLLNFHLFVTSNEFAMYKNQLLHHANVSCRTCGRDTDSMSSWSGCACDVQSPQPDWGRYTAPVPLSRPVGKGSEMYGGGRAPVQIKMGKGHVSGDRVATNADISYRGIVHPSGIGNPKLRPGGHRREMFQVA